MQGFAALRLRSAIDRLGQAELWLPVVAVVCLFCVFRLPILSDPGWQPDEGMNAYLGMQLAHGHRPYIDFWDHKPPLLWWLFAANFVLAGPNLLPVRLCFALASALAIALTARVAHTTGGPGAAVAAMLFLTLLLAPPPFTNGATSAEELIAPCVVLAFALTFANPHPSARADLLAGVALGLACALKPNALLYLPGWMIMGAFTPSRRAAVAFGARLAAGWLLGMLPLLVWLLATASMPAFWDAVVRFNTDYYIPVGWMQLVQQFAASSRHLFVLVLTTLVLLLHGRAGLHRYPRLFGWLAITFATAYVGGGYLFSQYFIPLYPPLALLLALGVVRKWKSQRTHARLWLGAAALTLAVFVLVNTAAQGYYSSWYRYFTHQEDREQYSARFDYHPQVSMHIAAYLKQHTQAQDSVYIWGWANATWVYLLSERDAAVPYVWNKHVLFAQRAYTLDLGRRPAMMASLQRNRPLYYAEVFPDFPQAPLPPFAELRAYIQQYYHIETVIDAIPIWRRNR